MRAALDKIITDREGETKLTFAVPSSELAEVVQLNRYFETELVLEVKPADSK